MKKGIKELENKNRKREDLNSVFDALEREGRFDANINPIDWDGAAPVTPDFPYIPKGWLKLKYALVNFFIVKPFTWYQAKVVYRLKTVGKDNLKGIKSAIVTSNHVAIFDCLVNAYALRGRRVKTVAAEFNNRKGRFGGYMRVGGMLPLGSSREVMRKLSDALQFYLSRGEYIMFYPEQSMWELYEKPRPFKTGAFHYALKFNVPVIPIFITYRTDKRLSKKDAVNKLSKKNECRVRDDALLNQSQESICSKEQSGHSRVYFTVNITEPLYPNRELSLIEQAKDLAQRAYDACVAVYEKAYGKKLEYNREKNLAKDQHTS